MFTQFISYEDRTMSIRAEIASDASGEVRRMRDAALADIRARIGRLAADVDRSTRDIANVEISAEQLMLAGWQVEDILGDLLHDLCVDLDAIERGDA